jgi:hypothetical protein
MEPLNIKIGAYRGPTGRSWWECWWETGIEECCGTIIDPATIHDTIPAPPHLLHVTQKLSTFLSAGRHRMQARRRRKRAPLTYAEAKMVIRLYDNGDGWYRGDIAKALDCSVSTMRTIVCFSRENNEARAR